MTFRRIAALAVTAVVLAAAGAAVPVQARQATTSADEDRASWLNLDALRVAGLFLAGGALVWFVVDTDEADSK